MRLSSIGVLAAGLLFWSTRPASAGGRVVRPCAPAEPAHRAATTELEVIDAAVRALGPAADPGPLIARIGQLAAMRCFQILDHPGIEAKSGLSLRTYWEDGGLSHLRSALELGGGGDRYVWTPPSARRALTAETSPQSPLAELLCPAAEPACAPESAGWVLRAEARFERAAELRQARGNGAWSDERVRRGLLDGDQCDEIARRFARREQFRIYRECFVAEHPTRTALPIGGVRALREGWLHVMGRRGHHGFCDETRAYDLATGATYRLASCSDLALRPGGSVDVRKTDQARRNVIEIGHLPVEALREAAWMMLLLDEVDRDVRPSGAGLGVPSWMEVVIPRQGASGGLGGSFSTSISSGQTRLTWRIRGGTRVAREGTLTYPENPNDDAADHAIRLLQIAEAAFTPGCPRARPPAWITEPTPSLSAPKLDSDGASLTLAAKSLATSWRDALARQASCPRPAPP